MRRIAGRIIQESRFLAEIGCGSGLLQKEIEDRYSKAVTGFDLNELALRQNVSRISPIYCYDIHQRNPEFRGRFDLALLFDVLEHIEDESGFLQAVKFHLNQSGTLLINVPAHQFLYSDYDRAAGHVRRYSLNQLIKVAAENGFKVREATYWGLPLFPLLALRKPLKLAANDARAGFDSRGKVPNSVLSLIARCEKVPQTFLGTSVMAVFQNQN